MEIKIKTDCASVFNFTRMQNDIQAVRSIVVQNLTDTAVEGASIRISFDPDFAHCADIPVGKIAPKGRALISGKDVSLSYDFFSNLSEPCRATLSVRLLQGSEVLAEEIKEVELLPYDHWEGLSLIPETVASYVVPNHPQVKEIVAQAAERLGRSDENSSMDAYMSGSPERVRVQMEAIYNEISRRGVGYADIPASFHKEGQRVRMPEEILSKGLASCLDLALLYAGCLEAAGIRPVIVFKPGHAFAGAWTVKTSSPYAVNDDLSLLRKASAEGISEIALVETTGMTKSESSCFKDALASADGQLSDPDDFICFVDVHTARKMGVRPLPQRVLTPDGYIIKSVQMSMREDVKADFSGRDDIDLDAPVKIGKHDIWERRLLDLTLNNALLNIRTSTGCVQLMTPGCVSVAESIESGKGYRIGGMSGVKWSGVLLKKGIYAALSKNDVLWDYSQGQLSDGYLHSFLDDEATEESIAAVRRAAKLSLEENGANTLFLAVGALRWFNEEGKGPYIAPIILYPVEFGGFGNCLSLTDEDPIINMTLLEMLRQKFGLSVPGLDPLPVKHGGNVDVRLVLNTIRRAVMDQKGWDVDELSFVGNFLFGKFIIWNDIHSHRKMLDSSSLVKSLVDGKLEIKDIGALPEGCDLDAECPSDRVLLPLSADSSQLRAIAEASRGRSFVMHGPPGTGKSQTITNMIANALYHSKRVLFVSEKMAALEVVQARLTELGLDPFCLEMHSNKIRKSVVMRKLEATLAIAEPHPDSCFAEDARECDALRAELNAHVRSLHRVYPAGLSLYDCLSRSIALGNGPQSKFPLAVMRRLRPSNIREMETVLEEYLSAIRHSGIDGSCALLDMPVNAWTPEYERCLRDALSAVSDSKGVSLLLKERKLRQVLGAPLATKGFISGVKETKAKAVRWLESIEDSRSYAVYASYRNALRKIGLGCVSDAYESGESNVEGLKDFFLRSLYRSYADYIFSEEKGLNIFCGDIFESRIERFRNIDAKLRESSRTAIFAAAASRLPRSGMVGINEPEMTTLLKAIRNGCRGQSLRTLFSKIPSILPRICPCMLMSPLSVSQYLASDAGMFDLVIFDEASQLPTSEAVAAIARAKAVVVVGDENQLPPTSFFQAATYDEDNVDIEDLDSILDDSLAIPLPSNHLRWHYRSRHESLIAFSNANYYDNHLLTFPSNDDLCSKVTFQKVEGVYDRGRSRQNPAEAEAVVEDIKRRLSDPYLREQTIGVVTFSVAQQSAIEKRLEEMLRRNPALRKAAGQLSEEIFIKNLESVQGDERDVILFSVGYGADSKGRVPMNFGPLNQNGGWRRLNVAVSRSRLEMKVFSSILPEQIPSSGLSKGVADLRAFLSYAIGGRETLETVTSKDSVQDAFVDVLADGLRTEGRTVDTHIGSSDCRVDIGIVDSFNLGHYSTGILVDGASYGSAESARDREVIRPDMLASLGWKLERKWILDNYGK